jgi:hypothetical protein
VQLVVKAQFLLAEKKNKPAQKLACGKRQVIKIFRCGPK